MTKLSKMSNPIDFGPVIDSSGELGGYTVNFVTFKDDLDHTPLLRGLPDDMCQCPHWGYVISGRLRFRTKDGEEVFETGDAFHVGPGHIPVANDPGTIYVQLSPPEELRLTEEAIERNMATLTT